MKAKMIVVAVLIVVGLCFPAWALDGIVSHWKFDEGSGNIAYDSTGINDGSIYGATWTTGKIDGALSFDDVDDYVVIADDPSLRFTQYDSFSVSFWAKPSNGGYVFSKLNAYPQSGIFGYALRWLSDTYKFQFMTQESGVDNVFVDTTNNSVHAGIWYFGTAVYDNKNMKVYLNAELKGTNFFGLDTGNTSPDNNFAIGVRLLPSILEQHFGGIIDDVIIFDRALSDQEIREIYIMGMGDTEWTLGVPVMEVNTEYAEWDPFLSADGLSLYYSKGKTDTFYFHRLYQAARQEPFGPFTSIKEISELNYSGGHIQDPWVSADNLRLYYMRTEPGNYWRLKFSERKSVNDPWPVGVNISELNVLNQMLRSPTLTADELTIFFSSFPTNPIPGGEGGDDIWMATRPDRYSPFGNITNQIGINTANNEGGPSVSPDGLTLVFDSHRNGPSQLFKATRQSLTQPFGNIEHLWACDTPGGSSATPCLSSDGSAIYYRSHTATRSTDIFVSYLAVTKAAIDIKPGSCPNPLNVKNKGVLPVAILGSEDFDVQSVDVASIRLAGVAPIRSNFEDVAAPVSNGNECECSAEGPDGFIDLTLKFETQMIVEVIGEVEHGDELALELTGVLSDETHIEGSDCVIIRGRHKPLNRADFNGDGIVDMSDFAAFSENWLQSSIVEY